MIRADERSSVILVGSYPPPVGGISVHVERLAAELGRRNCEVTVLDLYGDADHQDEPVNGPRVIRALAGVVGAGLAVKELVARRFDVFHVHVSGLGRSLVFLRLLLLVSSSRTRLITIHSGSFVPRMRKGSVRMRRDVVGLLRRFDRIICVGAEQRDWLIEAGIERRAVTVIPAFLGADRASDPGVEQVMNSLRLRNDLVVATSGSGHDYYGYDTILDAVEVLRREEVRVALVVAIYGACDDRYYETLEKRIEAMPGVVLLRDLTPAMFGDVLFHADVYARATDRDGDSVAIREALQWKCHVIATDVVVRPKECDLFQYGDVSSLVELLKSASAPSDKMSDAQSDLLLALYEDLL